MALRRISAGILPQMPAFSPLRFLMTQADTSLVTAQMAAPFRYQDSWRSSSSGLTIHSGKIPRERRLTRKYSTSTAIGTASTGVLNQPVIQGVCGTCHDSPNVGNHSVKAPLNIGVANAGADSPPALDIAGLPVFTIACTSGPLAGAMFEVTDPGRALITGKCADIGKVKGPILRGLAARAPYFQNGSAATLADVVEFYDQRFAIGFTEQQKADLVAFLSAL